MDNLTELYCVMDDFCKVFESELNKRLLASGKRKRLRATDLSLAELMTLVVLFHQIRYRQFKSFYLNHVCQPSAMGISEAAFVQPLYRVNATLQSSVGRLI